MPTAASIVTAGNTQVLGRDGAVYAQCPTDVLPPRGIAHLCDTAVALISNDGKALVVLPDTSAAHVVVEIPEGHEAGAIVPLATGRVAVSCITSASTTTDGAAPAITHVCLVDCVAPVLEQFTLPSTPRPVVAIAPLATATLALILDDGTAAAWSPAFPDQLAPASPMATDVAKVALVWWDSSVAVTMSHPAALHAVGWLRGGAACPTNDNTQGATPYMFGIASTGEILAADATAVPNSVKAWLADDAKSHILAPAVGPLTLTGTDGAIPAVSVQGASWLPRFDHPEFVAVVAERDAAAVVSDATCVVGASVAPSWSLEEPCPICFDDIIIGNGECVALECGHAFHKECLESCLARAEGYVPKGHRIVFNMCKCPQGCGRLVRHPCFAGSARIAARHRKVLADVTERAMVDYPGHAADEVLDGYLYYVCGTCGEPYWGGSKDCAAMMSGEVDANPLDLQCRKCAYSGAGPSADPCTAHGTDFLFHKCSYCCNIASDFSLGRLWLCQACIAEKRKEPVWGTEEGAVQCVGPDLCPLGGHHRPSNRCPVGCLLCFIADEKIEQGKLRQPPAEDATAQ